MDRQEWRNVSTDVSVAPDGDRAGEALAMGDDELRSALTGPTPRDPTGWYFATAQRLRFGYAPLHGCL